MQKRICIGIAIAFALVACACFAVGASIEYERTDTVAIYQTLQAIQAGETPPANKYDYTVLRLDGSIVHTTCDVEEMSYAARISRAAADGDLVSEAGEYRVIFYLRARERFERQRDGVLWMIAGACGAMAAVCAACVWATDRRMLRPFRKLRKFAERIAQGDLENPLEMDRYGAFGAFTEAFDIMRNNLRASRIAEQKAAVDKRQLTQEIGHDIKSPLASIRALAECGQVQSEDPSYAIILDKVRQIEMLTDDFYRAALEEEGQLGVFVTRHKLTELAELIRHCDYNKRVQAFDAPAGRVLYDAVRMVQIVENIVGNSYKYADTEIAVAMRADEDRAEIELRDSGPGVAPEQLSYVTDRFYRGEKTSEKMGQGLGLHIARKLIVRMGGEMTCRNDGGFVVTIRLPYADAGERNEKDR